MLKKLLFSFLILILILIPFANLKAEETTTTLTNNEALAINIYPSTFDNLVFDFTIKPGSQENTLNALTINNLGNAGVLEISKLILWSDAGQVGFQGLGVDKNLGELTYSSLYYYWYIQGLSEAIPTAGLRLFISLETNRSSSITTNRTIQLQIQERHDYNQNNLFDLGESGIFLASGENLPSQNITNANTQAILSNSGDGLYPKVVITSPVHNAVVSQNFTITGQAKDSGGSNTESLQIKIGENDSWHNVTNLGSYYLNWEYAVSNLASGTYNIFTQAKDGVGNSTNEAYQINLTVSAPATTTAKPAEEIPTTNPPAITTPTTPILYKSSDSSTVYLIDNINMIRRPIFNAVIFEQHGYDWQTIEVKPAATLANYKLGQAVVYTNGTLLKFYTGPYVYLVKNNNQLEHIPSEEAFLTAGYKWQDVRELPDSYLTQYVLLP